MAIKDQIAKYRAIKWGGLANSKEKESFQELAQKLETLARDVGSSSGIPSGMIAFFLTDTPPTGWEEVTELRGRFPRGMEAGGTPGATGGTSTHNHGGDTGENRAAAYNISFASGSVTQALARHNHDHTMSSDSHIPPYVDGIWCRKL